MTTDYRINESHVDFLNRTQAERNEADDAENGPVMERRVPLNMSVGEVNFLRHCVGLAGRYTEDPTDARVPEMRHKLSVAISKVVPSGRGI